MTPSSFVTIGLFHQTVTAAYHTRLFKNGQEQFFRIFISPQHRM
jgi:hypothetical protein